MGTEISKLFVTIAAKTDDFVKGVGDVNKKLMGVGAAMGAVGAAGLKMVDSAREINSQLQSTGVTIGATTAEMRNMVLEVANVTFEIQSAAATFDILARAGMRNKDEMVASANAFDALADATGSSAEVVADQLIPAFKAMGERIPTTTAEMDKFTWLAKNTTTDLSEFAMVMNYVAMYGEGLNVTLDEMIAIMAVLESKGKGGATATRLFRTAVSQAKDGSVSLNEALGITQEEIDGYVEKMQSATGITQQHADALNEQYGVMDKLRFLWSKLQFVIGSVLTPLEPVFAIMTAMTPVMIFLSTSIGRNALVWMAHAAAVMQSHINTVMHIGSSNIMTGTLAAQYQATALATGAQHGLNAAMKANPIIAIIAAIAALV
nr:phage tail tape measure protein [Dehalococcoidales bacterium]